MDFDDAKGQISDRLDPIEVIGQYLRLQRAGQRFKGLCPFHEEKTPSFTVDPSTGLWYCFGCSQGGDLFSFVMQREGLAFPEALRMLADRAGVKLERDPLAKQKRERRDLLEKANEIACRRFIEHLFKAPAAEQARLYLQRRGFSREMIDRFKIGYALDEWDDLLNALASSGITAEIAEETGLAKRSDRGGHYDTFRGRIVFPISDMSGRTIGFGGRAMDPDNPAKYLNSPETPLFRKRRTVYALDLARQAISSEGIALIVEGYTDVVSLHQAGITNVVAGLGTALAPEQLELLGRYAREVVLVYDADAAGARAALNNLEVVEQAEITASLIVLPENTDPDEFVTEHGAEAFEELLSRRISPVEYQLRMVFSEHRDLGPDGAAIAAREAVDVLLKIDDWPRRDEFVGRAADLWGQGDPARTESMGRVLKMEMQRRMRGEKSRDRGGRSSRDSSFITETLTRPPAGLMRAATELLVHALDDEATARIAVAALTPEDMLTEADAFILRAIAEQLAEQDQLDARALIEGLPEEGGFRRRGVELSVTHVERCPTEDADACTAQIESTIRRLLTHRRSGGAAAQALLEATADDDSEINIEDFQQLQAKVIDGINSGELSLEDSIVQQYYAICRRLRGSRGRGYFGERQAEGAAPPRGKGSSAGQDAMPMEDPQPNTERIHDGTAQDYPAGPPADDPWAVEDGDPFLDDE